MKLADLDQDTLDFLDHLLTRTGYGLRQRAFELPWRKRHERVRVLGGSDFAFALRNVIRERADES